MAVYTDVTAEDLGAFLAGYIRWRIRLNAASR